MQEIIDEIGTRSDRFGRPGEIFVYCVSAVEAASTPLCWSHYADSHRGVCIYLDSRVLPLRVAHQVVYSEDYPQVLVPRTAQDDWERARNMMLTKCKLWAYEAEYRAVQLRMPYARQSADLFCHWDGDVALGDATLARSVTLGYRMDDGNRHELIEWIETNAPHVEVWQATLHRSQYQVQRECVREA
jgi:hypothetical protein